MAKDKDYNRLIHQARWVRLRAQVLGSHPLCAACMERDRPTPATEVHHVTPVEYGLTLADKERLMFDPGNLRPLCHACHVDAHTALGRSGKGANVRRNQATITSAIAKLYGDTDVTN